MGVVGLTGWLQCLLSSSKMSTSVDWSAYKGQKIGIDILGFLYRAKSRRHSTILYVARLIAAFRRCGIEPVPIFDGKPPDEKRPLLEERATQRISALERCSLLQKDLLSTTMTETQRNTVIQEVQRLTGTTTYFTGEERELIKQIFYICGVKPLNASGEADNTLAYLAKKGELAAVISHDMDLLVRGVECLLVPDTYALPGDSSGWISYSLTDICKKSMLSYTQFVHMSVLMGCDYTHGLRRFPYRVAYSLIRNQGNLIAALHHHRITDTAPYETALSMLLGTRDTPESLMNERQWEKWHSGPEEPEWAMLFAFKETLFRSLSEVEFRNLCSLSHRVDRCTHVIEYNTGRPHDHPESSHG